MEDRGRRKKKNMYVETSKRSTNPRVKYFVHSRVRFERAFFASAIRISNVRYRVPLNHLFLYRHEHSNNNAASSSHNLAPRHETHMFLRMHVRISMYKKKRNKRNKKKKKKNLQSKSLKVSRVYTASIENGYFS